MSWRSAIYLTVAAVALSVLVAGCGGGSTWYYGEEDYPQYHYLTLYLRVEDPWGDPVRGAKVTIDGEQVDGLTAGRWYEIGYEGPAEWRGWEYNWGVQDFQVRINHPGQVRHLTVRVEKSGLGSDEADVVVEDDDPDEIYVRIIFVLGAGTQQAKKAPVPEYFPPRASTPPAAGTTGS